MKQNMFKQGFWQVNSQIYLNKYQAFYSASREGLGVRFIYNDDIWEKFDRTLCGKIGLNELYRQRAQQLRDRYDYLVLYYSGGADSHNVLRTFIDNKIKLDEICVKWPDALRDGKFYTPNVGDKSTANFWSEWNFSIRPVLEWVSKNTTIKINIIDPLKNYGQIDVESIIDVVDHDRNPGAIILNNFISNANTDFDFKVGNIYGIDKPLLVLKDNQIHLFFSDFPFTTLSKNSIVQDSAECFYWAPDFPLLTYEMAHRVANVYKSNPIWIEYLRWGNPDITGQFHNDLVRQTCYTTWDWRFQADKPTDGARNDKYGWFNRSTELVDIRTKFNNVIKDRKDGLSDHLLTSSGLLKTCHTKTFKVIDL